MSSDPRMTLDLTEVAKVASEKLAQSEYLIERHYIEKSRDYEDISVTAKWNNFGSISLVVTFFVTKNQEDSMKAYLDEEVFADDVDSGAGEVFEELLKEFYPNHNWDYPIGKVVVKLKKKK